MNAGGATEPVGLPVGAPRDRSGLIPWFIAVLAASGLLAVLVDSWLFPDATHIAHQPLPWILLLVAFAATESFDVNLELGENAHSFTINEIPMVIGLFFLSPGELVAARVIGGLIVLIWPYRHNGVKFLFNAGLFIAEAGVALLVFHSILALDWGTTGAWIGAIVAVIVMNALGALSVSTVINLSGGQPDRLSRVLALGTISTFATANLGLLAVELLTDDVSAVWMLAPVIGVLYLAYRQYGSLQMKYSSLRQLHEFTRVLAASPELTTTIHHSLQQARAVMSARSAEICLFERGKGWSDVRLTLDDEGELHTAPADDLSDNDPLLALMGETGGRSVVIGVGPSDEGAALILESRQAHDLAACALLSSGQVIGSIAVLDHRGQVSTFADEDLHVFETLANHVSVSLEKARLIDQLRSDAAEKEYQALHDQLTGLGNRSLFMQLAELELESIRNEGGHVAVLLMDLNRFKDINDTLGHHAGDVLLGLVADRLAASLRPGDTAMRLGGDEFVFLLPNVRDRDHAQELGAELLHRLAEPFTIGNLGVAIGAALGIAVGPEHGADPGTLLQHADIAMYSAKEAGEGRALLFNHGLTIAGTRRLSLGGELRTALDNGDLEVHYQPVASIRSGEIMGMEALLRWNHSSHGWIPPEDIVALAEHLGLIRPLTTFVLEAAARQCCQWRLGGYDLHVAVNLATQSLIDANLPTDIIETLDRSGLAHDALILEITETQVIREPEQTLDVLHRLNDSGITIAVDDFGTGYSSLSYLTRLPVGEIKIDKSFVQQMMIDPTSQKIVRSIVDLGANLAMTVVAEGVEGLLVWDALDQMGCDLAQGYYLSRPADGATITDWMRARRRRSQDLAALQVARRDERLTPVAGDLHGAEPTSR